MGRTKVSGFLLIIVSLRGFAVCGRRNCIANPGIQLGTERSVPFRCNLLSLFEEKVGNRRAHVRLSLSCPPFVPLSGHVSWFGNSVLVFD
jgi:hypothetical protein